MFIYNKLMPYPINVKKKNLKLAKAIYTLLGGPYGELGAALRYLSQRFTMPDQRGRDLLSDIGVSNSYK